MRIFIPRETDLAEKRVAVVPATVAKLLKLGAQIGIEAGLGQSINIPDADYISAGATVAENRLHAFASADMVLRLGKPPLGEIGSLKSGSIHISYLDPFNEPKLLGQLAEAKVGAICMEMIPRSTIAQKMDALSSQANLAGYVAVILAAESLNRIFPMMMTPSGTIRPARVFIIGAGVAGLQAIATAKRLGATVEAFDTRPVVEEQVRSLGAKFVKVDLGETGQTVQGYARELTPEQLEKQRQVMTQSCFQADVVITTAQIFGRSAPRILTTAMVKGMMPGSVVVDLAIETGGNVECARLNEEVVVNGVKVLGYGNMAGRVPRTASEMYSNNLGNLVDHFWDGAAKSFKLDPENAILKECLVTHGGTIHHKVLGEVYRNFTESQARSSNGRADSSKSI